MDIISRYGLAALVILLFSIPSLATHTWNNYHWARTSNPFELRVVDSVTSSWQSAFDRSLAEWNRSSILDNTVSAVDEGSKTRKRCQMVLGQMHVCNAAYGQNGWLGMASINIDSKGHITQGTAKMNDSYAWYFAQVPGEANHVMCQEIGHVYGLGHTSEDGSSQNTCMDYSTSLDSQWPNQHDFDQLDLIYGHTDTYNSYSISSSSTSTTCAAPPGQGCNKPNTAPDGVPAAATRVHYRPGLNGHVGHAEYAIPDGNGGLWLFHLTLLPEGF